MKRTYLVTGGAGFLGSALVSRLVRRGARVRVLDNLARGAARRLAELQDDVEVIEGDVRDAATVLRVAKGVDSVFHLAFINGTEFFYSRPELVLEVGVKGMLNVLDACRAAHVGELILASSSEVYQTPPTIPTNESVPLSIPDPTNPRYSYAGGKIISELLAINYGREAFDRVLIVRPHNVYGPDMGWEHVIPQFALRVRALSQDSSRPIPFPIQGTGKETRAFIFIDDCIEGIVQVLERGAHLGIYHIGTMDEVSIETVAHLVAEYCGRRITVIPGPPRAGSALRRCPDISKLAALGFAPRWSFRDGLAVTVKWYTEHPHLCPDVPHQGSAWNVSSPLAPDRV